MYPATKSIRTSSAILTQNPASSSVQPASPSSFAATSDGTDHLVTLQHYDEKDPLGAKWIPYSPTCEPATDWLAKIATQDIESLSWLANRTILVLGDSVDRNGLHHLAEMVGLPRYCVPYDDFEKKGVVPEGWDERGIPWVVEIPWLNTYFTNGFMYGLVSPTRIRSIGLSQWLPLADVSL